MRDICDKYVKTRVQCGYCQRWFHFKCENTTEEQVSEEDWRNKKTKRKLWKCERKTDGEVKDL